MTSPFDPINRGFIIIAIVGLMLLMVAVLTGAAPDLIEDEGEKRLFILRIPLIGPLLALLGVGEVPILFLLGIYPFMIGTVGWSGNLLWHWYYNVYPTTSPGWWVVRLIGVVLARGFTFIAGRLRRLLKTHTVAEKMIPERFIGITGKVLAVLGNGMLEVGVHDDLGKCLVQIYCLPWENATDKSFAVGDQVYIVDLIAPRRYSVVKFDSEDQMRTMANY
ncbi:hypothetical protein [Gloeothece verrucosa]|nr:hypothetical protein [Gloeothece verrucosa]